MSDKTDLTPAALRAAALEALLEMATKTGFNYPQRVHAVELLLQEARKPPIPGEGPAS